MAWKLYLRSKVGKCSDCVMKTPPRARGAMLCFGFFCVIVYPIFGIGFAAEYSYCNALYFGTGMPISIILPDLRNLSLSEVKSLQEGSYKLSSEYYLKRTEDYLGVISLCVQKRYFTTVSACFEIGTDVEQVVVCGPDMRPDCVPGSIVDHFFGVSFWWQNDSTVVYSIVNIETSAIYGRTLTNTTTTLSALWYDTLGCQVIVNMTIAAIVVGILAICCIIPCLGCALWCVCDCYNCPCCEEKWVYTPAVHYGQLQKQELEEDDRIELCDQIEAEENCFEGSSALLEDEIGDVEAASLSPSELLQNGWSDADQGGSSGKEEEVQVEVHPAGGVSSRESVHTAVSERGHRKHGRRSRFVHSKPPLVGYFLTDSSSMSGVATDVSMNDASDEESSDEAESHLNGQLSSTSSSSSVTPRVQEASGVGTPPPFAHFHPTTVYDHRPGVTAEPRQPPDGI